MSRLVFVLGLIVSIFLVSLVFAGIPKMINYQGMLTQSDGKTPVTNGNYDLTFKIYGSSGGADSLWTEHHLGVTVTNGLFNVILGSVTTLNLAFDADYWLGIKVGTDPELSPRIRLTSVGYAYRAENADTAQYARSGGGGTGSPWVFRLTDGNDTTITTGGRWGIARYGNVLYGDADSTHVNLGVACTTGTSGQNYKYCTVGGGNNNAASGGQATLGGGYRNTASGVYATVGGGWVSVASGAYATVGGGWNNVATGAYATMGGGSHNAASGEKVTVGGGSLNTASGGYATVAGGYDNTASGNYSFAAGRRAKANHLGTFVWADSSVNTDFASTDSNQFLIRASGGVGIGTNSPDERLHVENSEDGGRSFLQIAASHASNWGEAGMRIKTPQNTWHLRLDDDSNNNIPDGALGLRSQDLGSEVMVWTDSGRVGIGTTSPQGKLDVSSTTGAFIVPRMTTTQRDALSPVNGMIIYNTTTNQFNFRENGAWITK